jgi:3-hydroxyisobutyrate dehydrogenase/putative dehydrogenase
MGGPMAACLVRAGHEVRGYDIDPARVAQFVAAGGQAAPSPAEAVTGAQAVAVMVATAEQVEEVLFGPSGASVALAAGVAVVVMATVGPQAVADWSQRLAGLGVDVVDAPVSGGTARAAAGDLLVMVAGAPAAVDRVHPLLAALARQAPTVGAAAGDGQRVKLVNQLLCGVHIAAAAEALAFAEATGLDARACWETIRHGAAASFMLDDRGERMLSGRHDDVRSALDIFVKDMGLVLATAEAHRFPAPLARAAQQRYRSGARAGLGRRDDSVLIEVARGRADAADEAGPATPATRQ